MFDDETKEILKATQLASQRVRAISYAIALGCIVTATALLNARAGHWSEHRTEMVHANERQLIEENVPDNDLRWGHLNAKYRLFYAQRADRFVVRVPALGIQFDIEDLGIVAGISFIVLMLMMRYSAWRELDNLNLLFGLAKEKGCLKDIYISISSHQVLAVPQPMTAFRFRSLQKRYSLPRGVASRVILFMPIAVQLAVIVLALSNDEFPGARFAAGVVAALSAVLLFVVSAFIWQTHVLFKEFNALMDCAATEVKATIKKQSANEASHITYEAPGAKRQ